METSWMRLVVDAMAASPRKICEFNVKDGIVASALLQRWPSASYVGLAFSADREAGAAAETRAKVSAALHSAVPSGLDAPIHMGDKMRTVRAAPLAFDACGILVVDMHDATAAGSAGSKKIAGDLPNLLQRIATEDRSNVLVLHGRALDCSRRAVGGWCASWDELLERRLVTSAGCAQDPHGERWCVGRVATDSACSKRAPLLPASLTMPRPLVSSRGRLRFAATPSTNDAVQRSGRALRESDRQGASPRLQRQLAREAAGWSAAEVEGLRLGYWWRYFTVISSCGHTDKAAAVVRAPPLHVCLVFKNHVFESWVGGVTSTDGGRSFGNRPSLVMPTTWHTARMTHNLAIAALTDRGASRGFAIVGGQFKLRGAARCGRRSGNLVPCRPNLPSYNGLWMAHGQSWRFMRDGHEQISTKSSADEIARSGDAESASGAAQWTDARWLFNGTHPGCIERRSRFYASMAHLGTCEFDGRLSLVDYKGRMLLYARANPATHGQRFVQVTSSVDGGRTWGRFSFISLSEYDYSQGDVYFFAVSSNPVHDDSLIAFFPLAHKFRGCIGVAVSADGLLWSAPTPLLRCAVHGERAVHHPAQGLVRDGDTVALFVHENVPGVTSDLTPTPAQMIQFPYLKLPRPRLMRYTIPSAALLRWTLRALRTTMRNHTLSRRERAQRTHPLSES